MPTNETQNTRNAARDAVIQNQDIENEIRQIVVQALKEGDLQAESIKQAINDVLEGALEAQNAQSSIDKEALRQVVSGIDLALSQIAEASKLAIEEASGNIKEFTNHDLKRALNDLKDLEVLFFETLNDVAKKGTDTLQETLKEFISHAKNTGSSVSHTVEEILTGLNRTFTRSERLKYIEAADIAKSAGASIARIASGFLAGIADSLDTKK
jgi:polyhydroxyalkanoate synthesis regulator phasin